LIRDRTQGVPDKEKAHDTACSYHRHQRPETSPIRQAAREPAAEQHQKDAGEDEQSAKGKQKGQWGSQTAVFALMWLLHNIIPFQVT